MTTHKGALIEARDALESVVRVADRKTKEFDAARSAIDRLTALIDAVPEGLGASIVTCSQSIEGYVPLPFARKSFGNLFKAAALLAEATQSKEGE